MNLKKLPQEEKPRERLLKYGKNNVSNNELIEIILKSGTKRAGIKEISHNILSSVNNISELKNKNIVSRCRFKNPGYCPFINFCNLLFFFILL